MNEDKSLTRRGAIRELIELEQGRIDRDNRRTDLDRRALELANAQDERQFQYHSKALEVGATGERERLNFARSVVWALLGVLVLAVGLLFYMAFLGNDVQRETAIRFATTVPVGLAGWAVITGLSKLLQIGVKRP